MIKSKNCIHYGNIIIKLLKKRFSHRALLIIITVVVRNEHFHAKYILIPINVLREAGGPVVRPGGTRSRNPFDPPAKS